MYTVKIIYIKFKVGILTNHGIHGQPKTFGHIQYFQIE